MPVPGRGPQVRSRRESGLKATPEWGWGSPGPSPTTAPVSASRRRTRDSGCPPGPLAVDVAISRPSGLTAVIPYGPDGPSDISSASRGRPTGTERVGSPRRSRPHRRRPRPPTVRRCLPSRPKDTARIGPRVRSGGAIGPARGTSQIGIVPSSSPMARARPSGRNARHRTAPDELERLPALAECGRIPQTDGAAFGAGREAIAVGGDRQARHRRTFGREVGDSPMTPGPRRGLARPGSPRGSAGHPRRRRPYGWASREAGPGRGSARSASPSGRPARRRLRPPACGRRG